MSHPDLTAVMLLADPSPALRYRVLTELLAIPATDREVADLDQRRRTMPEVAELMRVHASDGLMDLTWRLCRLAWLGFDRTDHGVAAIAERVFAVQQADGSFPLAAFRRSGRDGQYSMIPLQTSLPLRGLAAAGYATDRRAERAYEWLLAQRLSDGAWPLGTASGQPGYIAGYRKLPGSKGCRVNTEGAIACLVLHPDRRTSEAARLALDLLLQRETREEWSMGTEVARLAGAEEPTGFITFYAQFDLAYVLDLASRAGASAADGRVSELVAFLDTMRGPRGLWQHPTHPELSRWLTFVLLLSHRRLETGEWVGSLPRVSFRAYPRDGRRLGSRTR